MRCIGLGAIKARFRWRVVCVTGAICPGFDLDEGAVSANSAKLLGRALVPHLTFPRRILDDTRPLTKRMHGARMLARGRSWCLGRDRGRSKANYALVWQIRRAEESSIAPKN